MKPEDVHELVTDLNELLNTLEETNDTIESYVNDRTHTEWCPTLRVAAECECGLEGMLCQLAANRTVLDEVKTHTKARGQSA